MIDILAICAHPDDLEACAGGIFLKAKEEGKKTGLIIMTRGESGGYAPMQTRIDEAKQGARILGVDYFVNLDFPDAGLEFSRETVDAVIPHLRACSPKIILTLHPDDYHPDHVAVSKITEAAAFDAGLNKYSTDGSDWHYDSILYFGADSHTNRQRPDIYIDISDVIEKKRQACSAHASQHITEFAIEMAREYGRCAQVEYAEGLYLKQSLIVSKVSGLLK